MTIRPRGATWAGRLGPGLALAGALGASSGLADDDGPILCWSRRHFDSACPSCGLTRGVAAFVEGDFAASIALHPLASVLVIQAVVLVVFWALRARMDLSQLAIRVLAPVLAIDSVALIVVWVVRASQGTLPPV